LRDRAAAQSAVPSHSPAETLSGVPPMRATTAAMSAPATNALMPKAARRRRSASSAAWNVARGALTYASTSRGRGRYDTMPAARRAACATSPNARVSSRRQVRNSAAAVARTAVRKPASCPSGGTPRASMIPVALLVCSGPATSILDADDRRPLPLEIACRHTLEAACSPAA